MSEGPTGRRGRLSRSGRFLPLVKPATIAPPAAGEFEEDDDYAEISIERDPIVKTPDPDAPAGEADVEDEATPPR